MKQYLRQLNLSHHLPIDIKLWCGSFELRTHPELSIKLWFEGINNTALVPQITHTEKGVQIRNQSLSSVFVRSDAIKIVMYVPDESDVTIRLATGDLWLAGSYQNLKARLWMGSMYCNMENIFVRKEAQLRLFSGNIFIENDDMLNIRSRAGHDSFQHYKFGNKAALKAITHLGMVHRKTASSNKGLCLT